MDKTQIKDFYLFFINFEKEEKGESYVKQEEIIRQVEKKEGWNVKALFFANQEKNEYQEFIQDFSKDFNTIEKNDNDNCNNEFQRRFIFIIDVKNSEMEDCVQICQDIRKLNKYAIILLHSEKLMNSNKENILQKTKGKNDVYLLWSNLLYSYNDLYSILTIQNTLKKERKPFLIGISGCSHSGKSTLSNSLKAHFESSFCSLPIINKSRPRVLLLCQDRFFDPVWMRTQSDDNWDTPGGLTHLELYRALKKHIDSGEFDIIILEGFMAFFDPSLTALFDVRFWIELDLATASSRRLQTQGMPVSYYEEVVWKNHLSYKKHVKYMEYLWKSPLFHLNGNLSKESILNTAISSLEKQDK